MKTICKVTKVSLLVAALGWMTAGCENRELDATRPQSQISVLPCKLQQYTATSAEGTTTGRAERTSYEYDALGRLVKTTSSIDNPAGGTLNTTIDYKYDDNGFLVSTVARTTTRFGTASGKMASREKLQTIEYKYENGRLASYVAKNSGTVLALTTVKGTYEYDAAGNLLTETALNTYQLETTTKEIPSYTSGLLRTWKFRQNQLTDYTEKNGSAESRPRTIENGLVTRITQESGYTAFEYNTQGRLTKSSLFVGERLMSYVEQEWSNRAVAATPTFKGFPTIKSEVRQDVDPVYGEVIRLSVNTLPVQTGVLSRYAQYADLDENGTMMQLSERSYSLQTNERGAVSSTKIETKQNGIATVTTTETFSYAGCN